MDFGTRVHVQISENLTGQVILLARIPRDVNVNLICTNVLFSYLALILYLFKFSNCLKKWNSVQLIRRHFITICSSKWQQRQPLNTSCRQDIRELKYWMQLLLRCTFERNISSEWNFTSCAQKSTCGPLSQMQLSYLSTCLKWLWDGISMNR